MMKKLLGLFAAATLCTNVPFLQAMSLNEDTKISISNKENISDFMIKNQKIEINKKTSNIKQDVFLDLGNIYPEYSDFFTDLIINSNEYLISGADFSVPVDPDGENYTIIVIALSTNQKYTGKLVFNVTLMPKKERIDISKYDYLFDKNNDDKIAKITIDQNYDSSKIILTKENALKAIDKFFVENNDSVEWHSTTGMNLLYENRDQLNVDIDSSYKNEGYTEGYFKITISPINESTIFMPKILVAYVHETVNFKTIQKSVNYSINQKIEANWSTNFTWDWDNENVWFKAIDIRDYLTTEEKNESNGDYIKSFIKKYNELTFYTDSGYVTNYNDQNIYLDSSYSLSLSNYDEHTNQSVKLNVVDYYDSGFGVYNSISCYIEFKFANSYELQYHIHAHQGVQGFGAKWQCSSMNFSFNKWIVS